MYICNLYWGGKKDSRFDFFGGGDKEQKCLVE